jgi:hypothetical protein
VYICTYFNTKSEGLFLKMQKQFEDIEQESEPMSAMAGI